MVYWEQPMTYHSHSPFSRQISPLDSTFSELRGLYRLTVSDSIVDSFGQSLDGNADGVAGGSFVSDFSLIPNGGYRLTVPIKTNYISSADGQIVSSGSMVAVVAQVNAIPVPVTKIQILNVESGGI